MKDKKGGLYIPIYLEWLDVTQDLTAEEKGNLIDAVVAYAAGVEYEHLLTGAVRICFRFLKGQVDRNREISEIRRNARQNKDEQPETDDDKPEQNETNGNKTEQNGTKLPKEKDKEKEEEKEKDKKRFVSPTLEQVTEYMQEIGCDIDPQYFLDYQTARNWILSNGKQAKDWKAVIRTWMHNNFSKPKQQGKVVAAQQYSQRDYSDEDHEVIRHMIANMQETG